VLPFKLEVALSGLYETLGIVLAALSLAVAVAHFHLYLESNGLVEAYQLVALMLTFV
jgi:hypothetical protein